MQIVQFVQFLCHLRTKSRKIENWSPVEHERGWFTFMKCDIISARFFGVGPLRISCIVQKLVWLNRLVNATIFGATVYLSFFVHAQLVSSSGSMCENAGKSSNVICPANSSGDKRNALSTMASKSLIDAFNGRLCVFTDGGRGGGDSVDASGV